jgi:hypothetical protein
MAERPLTIEIPGHAELHVTTRSGRATVIAEERSDVLVETGAPSEQDVERDATGRISFASARSGSTNLLLRCPTGTDIVVGSLSGHVELTGRFGDVRVTTLSGNIAIDQADSIDVRSMSGNLEVSSCSGQCRLQTKSGRAVIGSTDDAHVSTISGLIQLDDTSGKVRAQSVSGRIEVGTKDNGDVAVQTMSGSVKVAVPSGVRPEMRLRSMTGRPKTKCEEGTDCRIAIRSLSGSIEVVPR